MNLTYVIADMHGRADLYIEALGAIRDHSAKYIMDNRTLVVLGDFVDRGMRSAELITLLRERAWPHWRKVVLQGNHEAMMLECIANLWKIDWWMGNGGDKTLWSYGVRDGALIEEAVKRVPQGDLDWMGGLPMHYTDAHRVYVHAGLNLQLPLEDQTDAALQWMIWPRFTNADYFGKHIVHGHEHSLDHPLLLENRTNLDACAYGSGRLVIGVFDDDKAGGPIEVLTVNGKAYRDHCAEAIGN